MNNMKPGNLDGIKPRVQEEGKVERMRKEISSFGKEIYCGRVRKSIICIKIENTIIKFVHVTNP